MANSLYPQPKSLADFKRWLLTENATLTITHYEVWDFDNSVLHRITHRFEGIPRKVAKLQTNGVYLTTDDGNESWLGLDQAKHWKFDLGKASFRDQWWHVVYELHN